MYLYGYTMSISVAHNVSNGLDEPFTSYLDNIKSENLHKTKEAMYDKLPSNLCDLPHLILYGPAGVGKYSQMLNIIQRYSPTQLKYEKKIQIHNQKDDYYQMKISDIHYEIDMETLGCNAKSQWHTLYHGIVNIISQHHGTIFTKGNKQYNGIIVCKNFHHIQNELLDVFYSYMTNMLSVSGNSNYNIKFILVTESLSFLPEHIQNLCMVYQYSRPNRTQYSEAICKITGRHFKSTYNKMNENKIINLTNELYDVSQLENTKLFVSKLVNYIESTLTQFESSKDEPGMEVNADNFHQLREILYEVLIYNIPVFEVVYALLKEMMNLMTHEQSNVLMKNTYIFFRLYNNNYRPIFHLEKFVLDIISILTQHDTI